MLHPLCPDIRSPLGPTLFKNDIQSRGPDNTCRDECWPDNKGVPILITSSWRLSSNPEKMLIIYFLIDQESRRLVNGRRIDTLEQSDQCRIASMTAAVAAARNSVASSHDLRLLDLAYHRTIGADARATCGPRRRAGSSHLHQNMPVLGHRR
jgi:hypothetical protein